MKLIQEACACDRIVIGLSFTHHMSFLHRHARSLDSVAKFFCSISYTLIYSFDIYSYDVLEMMLIMQAMLNPSMVFLRCRPKDVERPTGRLDVGRVVLHLPSATRSASAFEILFLFLRLDSI